jgi:hypothetical protein
MEPQQEDSQYKWAALNGNNAISYVYVGKQSGVVPN